MKKKVRLIRLQTMVLMMLLLIGIFIRSEIVYAAEENDDYEYMLDELFEDNTVNEALDEVFGEKRVGIRELTESLLSGEKNVIDIFSDFFQNSLLGFNTYKTVFIKLMFLSIFCALFGFLPQVFGSEQASQMGHYISFIILTAFLMSILNNTLSVVTETIEIIVFLMNAIIPVLMAAIAISGAISTAGISVGVFEILIYFAQHLIYNFLCPSTMVFALVGFANQLLESDKFSRLVELIKRLISWILKGMLTLLIGFQFLQNLITPYVDRFNSSVTKQTLEAIPGVGDIASSGISIAVGAALIVKNAVGVVTMLILLAAVAAPVLELIAYMLVLMLINALLQPVLLPQILKILDISVMTVKLLFRIILTVILLFLISIALLVKGTGGS